MNKGIEFLEQIKYEIKHNSEFHTQSVKVPIRFLNELMKLAESNQYRLDLEIASELQRLHSEVNSLKKQNRKLSKLAKIAFNDTHEGERDVL